MRKDPDVVAKLPEEFWVDGEERYVAKASAFHNLHCLDYLRRTLYKDYYWPNGTDSVPFHDTHVSHCVMVLMEHLTCAPDTGVFRKLFPETHTLRVVRILKRVIGFRVRLTL